MKTELRFESRELIPGFPMYQGEVYIGIQRLREKAYPFSCLLRELEYAGVIPSRRLGRDEAQVLPIHDIPDGVEILETVVHTVGVDKRLGSQEVGLGTGKRINFFRQSRHRFPAGGDQE